jgi:hypothetical protein
MHGDGKFKGDSQTTVEMVHKTLIRPILGYALSACDSHIVVQIKSIEKIRRKTARYVMVIYV